MLDPQGNEKLPLSFIEGKEQYGSYDPFNCGVPVKRVHTKHHMVTSN